MCEIGAKLDNDALDMMDHTTYQNWRKETIVIMKEFDKEYVKHIKGGHPEMNTIHTAAMKPLTDLLESNLNFHYLELIEKKKPNIPKFRHEALETKFCEHLERICCIFRDYGKLENYFNIRRMINLLKIPDWQNCVPLHFYLTPLDNAIKDTRSWMIKMNEEGILRCKYIIEHNEELMEKCNHMVNMDVTSEWLMEDELKRD
jgi:hypothetical protein